MRGARHVLQWPDRIIRIIPADAGSTRSCWTIRARGGDHPRGCGEHTDSEGRQWYRAGSSPRMRGALIDYEDFRTGTGIIPADAGSTIHRRRYQERHPDHPRGCGEHHLGFLLRPARGGSSPRMRGAPFNRFEHSDPNRIIPADAGSTLKSDSSPAYEKDHPRGCGEHTANPGILSKYKGSSPRMRGARLRHTVRLPA